MENTQLMIIICFGCATILYITFRLIDYLFRYLYKRYFEKDLEKYFNDKLKENKK